VTQLPAWFKVLSISKHDEKPQIALVSVFKTLMETFKITNPKVVRKIMIDIQMLAYAGYAAAAAVFDYEDLNNAVLRANIVFASNNLGGAQHSRKASLV
jgi:hypothetical protein